MNTYHPAFVRFTLLLLPALGFLALVGCGDDGDGNDDSLFTGFSLVVIIIIAILVVRHFMKKRG